MCNAIDQISNSLVWPEKISFEKSIGIVFAISLLAYGLYLRNKPSSDIKIIQNGSEQLIYSINRERLFIDYKKEEGPISDSMKKEIAKCIQAFYVTQEQRLDHDLPSFQEGFFANDHEIGLPTPNGTIRRVLRLEYSPNRFYLSVCPGKISDVTWSSIETDIKLFRARMGLTEQYFI